MDMYTENNGGFQTFEGTSPFEEGYQVQGAEGFAAGSYQETVAEPAYYAGEYGAESLPAGQYQETAPEGVYYGDMNGAESLPAGVYQETAAGYGQGAYMEGSDPLPVEPGQILETGDPGLYQDMAPETEDTETEEPEEAAEPETAEAEPTASGEDDEETRRARHEEAEARRRAEWEEKQQAKKAAEQEKLDQLAGMSDDAAMSAAMKRVGADTEKLTRRNMKDCVAEYIQTLCLEDPGFARLVMHPRKTMIHCFHYINRKAKEFIQQEMEDNDIKPENGVYGSDVPDDLCYQWAEDYFRDPDAEEDRKEEEKFVSRLYIGKGGSKAGSKKTAEKKAAAKKPAGKKTEKPKQETDGQLSFAGQMSLEDFAAQGVKAG